MYMFLLLLTLVCVYGDKLNFFDTITHNFQFPHEKMGIIMHKHINNHTIPDNHTIVNQDERYLSNSQINMIEMHLCGVESSNTMRSFIYGVRVNYCFKCSITSSDLADINSCKYNVVNTSPNNFIWDFHTYIDTSCSTGDINQFDYDNVLNECYNNVKVIYTPNFQLDFTIPGLMEIEYSDTSCSTPFTIQIQGYVKDFCMQMTSGSFKTIECTNNNLQIQTFPTTDCSGNTYVEQSQTTDTCYVDNSANTWYDYISYSAVIVYSDEHLRTGRFCSSLYSPIINTNPTPYPTVGSAADDDFFNIDKGSCPTCPLYNLWEVKCGSEGTPNTDLVCSEGEDKFTCCSSKDADDCCVEKSGSSFGLVGGLIFGVAIVACGGWRYKYSSSQNVQQVATISNSTPYAQSGSEIIKPTIKPFQKNVEATLSNMEEGLPLAEAKIVPVEKPKNKKSKKRNR